MTEWLRYPEGIWPSLKQELLIRACISTGDELVDAWQQWRSQVDIDFLDTSSKYLLPALYQNLNKNLIHDPLMGKLHSAYLLARDKNQLLLDSAIGVIGNLEQAGIKTMLLKGLGMYVRGDMEIGSRHFYHADILIPYSQIANALSILNQYGWRQAYEISKKVYSIFGNNIAISQGTDLEVDLHWNIYFYRSGVNPDVFWDRAMPISFAHVKTNVMDPGDNLMFTCYHGACWNFNNLYLDWVLDAVLLLQLYQDQIDWERMINQAGLLNVGYTIWNAYRYINQEFDTQIPKAIIDDLQSIGENEHEIKEFGIKEKAPTLIFTAMKMHALNYLYFSDHLSAWEKVWKFPRFIQSIMQVNRIIDIPIALIKMAINKICTKVKK